MRLSSRPASQHSPARARYSPQQLYAVIADVDSYHSFLPFATASRVLAATRISEKGKERYEVRDKEWLGGQGEQEGERWEMDAELRIGAMGYEEGYVSLVETRKWDSVQVRLGSCCCC